MYIMKRTDRWRQATALGPPPMCCLSDSSSEIGKWRHGVCKIINYAVKFLQDKATASR